MGKNECSPASVVAGGRGGTACQLEVDVRSRKRSQGVSSCCGVRGPNYDRLEPRRFQFVPLWGIAVVLIYRMRRISCPRCGKVKVERLAWSQGKRPVTLTAKQRLRLRDVLPYDLKTVRAYLKIEAFPWLWQYQSPTWASKFLDAWCRDVMRSRLEPWKH